MKDSFDSTDENDFKCTQKYKNAKQQGSAGHIFWEQTVYLGIILANQHQEKQQMYTIQLEDKKQCKMEQGDL